MTRRQVTIDGNEAAAYVAYRASEVVSIYPITPASPMGELADQWAAQGVPNVWGSVPNVVEMQSEGGAAGAVHGSLQAGALTTTFTASQGLLLMVPNLYKVAGELTSTVLHIAARSVATHALSIFCDHSDVMAARQTGFAMLFSNSVQEAMDLAAVAHGATLEARVPFLHIFDGFRTSHEVAKIEELTAEDIQSLLDEDQIRAHRARALNPDKPFVRGTAQNPDVFFQAREAANPYYLATPEIVQRKMDALAARVGRQYHLFDYVGHPEAERVVILMGSGAEAAEAAVERLVREGERVGLVKVRLYRPFSASHFLAALPKTVRVITALDRTKEPGAREPLYLDVVQAVMESMAGSAPRFDAMPRVLGGRFGLSSKEFTPAMVKGVFDEMAKDAPRSEFTVGIHDDLTHLSVDWDPTWSVEDEDTVRCVFFGLGSDGTVGANKSSIKIIGGETPNHAQGYFVYDSKKAGAVTVSHLRFGPKPIRAPYLISEADFVACHQFSFVDRIDILDVAAPGATFLLNSPYGPEEVWDHLPKRIQQQIVDKGLKLYVIDANTLAREVGLGRRINMVMQASFFALSGVLPRDEAMEAIKASIKKTYIKRGEVVVQRNIQAVDRALENLHEVRVPGTVTSEIGIRPVVPPGAPEFVETVTAVIMDRRGDSLPVSALPADGTFPSATTRWEKRNITDFVPVWDESICIQCGKCVMACPHAAIRSKVVAPEALTDAPPTLKSAPAKWKTLGESKFILQVATEDCTGCTLCVEVCPVKNKSQVRLKAINMEPLAPILEDERANWAFFDALPAPDRAKLDHRKVKDVQLLDPLFEFSGACAGCGETPYLKLLSQLFGDRAIVANATGCSSIYGGNLPTTPWATNAEGRGPAWSNSLFEDNAEFGLGMRLAVDKQTEYARELVDRARPVLGDELATALLEADQSTEEGIEAQRRRVAALKEALGGRDDAASQDLLAVADNLVRRSVWLVGGDGWAYDIGYGGIDHVLASGRNVNILVMDTEVYSNTGGQMSKATPRGAVAKFAFGGKPTAKKDLAMMAIAYGSAYVARVAMGADDRHVVKAMLEAEAYDGPSIIIAYSHCIAHGYDLRHGFSQQKAAVDSGYWPLLRYNPDLTRKGQNPLQLDSKGPKLPLEKYVYNETRYTMLVHSQPEAAAKLLRGAQRDVEARWRVYQFLAGKNPDAGKKS